MNEIYFSSEVLGVVGHHLHLHPPHHHDPLHLGLDSQPPLQLQVSGGRRERVSIFNISSQRISLKNS